jgi:hypothetical protein
LSLKCIGKPTILTRKDALRNRQNSFGGLDSSRSNFSARHVSENIAKYSQRVRYGGTVHVVRMSSIATFDRFQAQPNWEMSAKKVKEKRHTL